MGTTHGYKTVPIPCPYGYGTRGYPYPWVKLPSLGDGMICSVISRRGDVVMVRYVLHPRCGVSCVMSTFLSRRFVVVLIRCELVVSYFSYWTVLLLPEHFLFILVSSSMSVALLIKHGESMFLEEHITVDIKIIYNNF
jgi:hypothetical protein